MKRLFALLLGLALLGGCVGAPEAERTEAASTAVMTTEAATETTVATVPQKLLSGEENGIAWRVVDLDSNYYVRSAVEKHSITFLREQLLQEYPLSAGKSILVENTGGDDDDSAEIYLRNKKAGTETLLLSGSIYKDWMPQFVSVIDERYFLFTQIGFECQGGSGAYDTVQKKTIWFEFADNGWGTLLSTVVDHRWIYARNYIYEGYDGPLSLFRGDFSQRTKGGPIIMVDLFKDSGVTVKRLYSAAVSADGKKYAVCDNSGLAIYDITTCKKLLYLPKQDDTYWLHDLFLYESDKLIWHGEHEKYAVEITLP